MGRSHGALGDPPSDLTREIDEAFLAARSDPRARLPDLSTLPVIEVRRFRLPNGLDVVLAPSDDAFLQVRVMYSAGFRDAPPGRTETPHIVEHLVGLQSARVPEGAFAVLEALGTEWDASTQDHRTNYYATAPPDSLATLLWLEAERMASARDVGDAVTLERERRVIQREAVYRNTSVVFAATRLAGDVWPAGIGPAFGAPRGEREVTLDDVRAFARRWYSPPHARLVVAGRFDPVVARAMVERYFGPIPRGDATPRPPGAPTLPLTEARVIHAAAPTGGPARSMVMLWPAPGTDEPGGAEIGLAVVCLESLHEGFARSPAPTIRTVALSRSSGYPSAIELVAERHTGSDPEEALAQLRGAIEAAQQHLQSHGCLRTVRSEYARGLAVDARDLRTRAEMIARWPDAADPGAFVRRLGVVNATSDAAVTAALRRWMPAERSIVVHFDRRRGGP